MLRFHRVTRIAVCALSLSLALSLRPCAADVRLPRIFGNQMVLQRDLPVRVWGKADPGEKVTVSIGKNESSATADEQGKWKVELPPLAAGNPVEVKVSGKNTITLRDVLVGEVWVCSGQSNMGMTVQGAADAKQEIAAATHPQIRLFAVPLIPSAKPADDCDAYWKECTPESVPSFSAVAYYFGRQLHEKLGVPIGLINTSWGGTLIEPWTPPVGFQSVPAVTSILTNLEKNPPVVPQTKPRKNKKGKKVAAGPQLQQTPTYLYNGMIHPLVPFAIRGAIWYQGESNLRDGKLYTEKMKALIQGWRSVWNEGEFPFYYVQLAPYMYGKNIPTALPLMWEAQTAALSIPNTGMAVTIDIGNAKDIHPKDKQDVGKRLALWALAKNYGKQIVYSGPLYKSMSVDGSKIRVKFDHVGGGLAARDGKPLKWFTVAGEDQKFVDAQAKIDGDAIVVSAPNVEKPVAVRFGWDQVADPNLANIEGLPASAFRTDRW
jgi:sialate O-acetylesterase